MVLLLSFRSAGRRRSRSCCVCLDLEASRGFSCSSAGVAWGRVSRRGYDRRASSESSRESQSSRSSELVVKSRGSIAVLVAQSSSASS